jgi:DNA-directed RNA polymerase specialized sigma24 family protein
MNYRDFKVLELRYFSGLSLEETAEVLNVSVGKYGAIGVWLAPGSSGN